MTKSRRQSESESGQISFAESGSAPDPAVRGSVRHSVRDAAGGPTPGVWGIEEVAAYLRVPVSAVYKMTARRAAVRIPHIRIGNKLRFRQIDIDRWLTQLTVSNLKVLGQMHQKVSKVIHGIDSQTQVR